MQKASGAPHQTQILESLHGSQQILMDHPPTLSQPTTVVRELTTSSLIAVDIAVDNKVPGRIFTSDTKAAAIYYLDTQIPGSAWQLYVGNRHVPGWTDGPRGTALLHSPGGLCVGPSGHLFFLDHGPLVHPTTNHSGQYTILRRVDALTGAVTTVSGDPSRTGFADGSGSEALLSPGSNSIVCSSDAIWVSDDSGTGALRRVLCSGGDCVTAPTTGAGPNSSWIRSCVTCLSFLALGALLGAGYTHYNYLNRTVAEAVRRYRSSSGGTAGGSSGTPALLPEGGDEARAAVAPLLLLEDGTADVGPSNLIDLEDEKHHNHHNQQQQQQQQHGSISTISAAGVAGETDSQRVGGVHAVPAVSASEQALI